MMFMEEQCKGLVAFDLDGTLTRGETVCEVIARQIGKSARIRELEQAKTTEEVQTGREEMADWYRSYSISELCSFLRQVTIAPGTHEAFRLLRANGIKTAIVSITWEFAVEWFARQFNTDFFVGTKLSSDRQVVHFWPEDKPEWIRDVALSLGLTPKQVAAVGDSSSDLLMLNSVEHALFVGKAKPVGLERIVYLPDGNISEIANLIVSIFNK